MPIHALSEHTRALAAYLPNGKMFEAKNIDDSNFNQLLKGLAGELRTAEGYLVTLGEEYFPDLTVLFLPEWERAVGIPDSCFPGTGDIDERRSRVLIKLASLGVQTAQDFVDLGALFGKTVTVVPLTDLAFPPYDVPFLPVGFPEARFTFIIEGVDLVLNVPPYDVPFSLVTGTNTLECLFNKVKPANTKIIIRNIN